MRLATTLLLGVLALASGLLVLHHRQGADYYWTEAALVYALVHFAALFFGIYSFFGWFFCAWAAGARDAPYGATGR